MNTKKIIDILQNLFIIFSIIFAFLLFILIIFNISIDPHLILTIWLFLIVGGLLIIHVLENKK